MLLIKKIGIDVGGSLIKIAYEESTRLHVKSYPVEKMDEFIKWINFLAIDAIKLVTGGRALEICHSLSNSSRISEFQALEIGTEFLLQQEYSKIIKSTIIVSIGTGTTILLNKNDHCTRISGTGLGGGTLMGLGYLLTGETSFESLVRLANQGDRLKADLLVSDIYTVHNDTSINGNLTAANFAKLNRKASAEKEDCMASLVNMIAENICLLALNSATQNGIQDIVFIGSTLKGNDALKNALTQYIELYGLNPYFLSLGGYAGAVGALNWK